MIPVSVVVLTHGRRETLRRLLGELERLRGPDCEVVVVDNGSDDGTAAMVAADFPGARLLALPRNVGVGARNRGLAAARGELCVCLDDDVGGLEPAHLRHLRARFRAEPRLGAVCFRVTRPDDGSTCDWVHRRPIDQADRGFETYEITEGAVALRREAAAAAGWYPEDFFLSHEGLDLAYRLLNRGWRIVYDPAVTVRHARHPAARSRCRRHYYDTRNLFWVAARNQPIGYACGYLGRGLAAMGAYSLRDGCLPAYLRAVRDGLLGVPAMRRGREPWTRRTAEICRRLDAERPGFWRLALRRLRRRGFTME